MVFRPSPAQIAIRKREIAKRYARKASRSFAKKPRTMAALRMADLTKLFDHRFNKMQLPESDDAVMCARIMAHHIGALPDSARRISSWLMQCTPWLPMAEQE